MNWTLARYRVRPEEADENARLISSVFAELQIQAPEGLRYGVIRVQDDTFVHIVSREKDALSPADMAAFKQFQAGIHDRCVEKPVVLGADVVGDYQMFDSAKPPAP